MYIQKADCHQSKKLCVIVDVPCNDEILVILCVVDECEWFNHRSLGNTKMPIMHSHFLFIDLLKFIITADYLQITRVQIIDDKIVMIG